MSLSLSQLLPGDIIVDNTHTGIFVGMDNDKHCIVNALTEGYLGVANLRCTSPISFLNACQTEDGTHYPLVFRCNNQELSKNAAKIARFITSKDEYKPTYDFKRLRMTNDFESSHAREIRLQMLHDKFLTEGLARIVKFAARKNINLTQSPLKGKTTFRGLICGYAVCLFFQMASLEALVEPITNDEWVSNKHADVQQTTGLAEIIGEETSKEYTEQIRDTRFTPIQTMPPSKFTNSKLKKRLQPQKQATTFTPAMKQWKGPKIDEMSREDFEGLMTKAFTVDPKYVTPHDLLNLLSEDTKNWEDVGYLSKKDLNPKI
jgi:hypothetical protein